MRIDFVNLQLGDVLYEFEPMFGQYIKSEVIELPVQIDNRVTWKSKNLKTGKIINYLVTLDLSHHAPKLYTYEAYTGCEQV